METQAVVAMEAYKKSEEPMERAAETLSSNYHGYAQVAISDFITERRLDR